MKFTPAALILTALLAAGPISFSQEESSPSPQESPEPADTPPQEEEAPEAAAVASEPPPSRRQLVDSLSEEEVEKALDAIKKTFLDPGAASDAALRRAALEGLIIRFEPGMDILPREGRGPQFPPHSFVAEILDSHIGYVRPGAINAAALAQFDTTLKTFSSGGADALILDLRSTGVEGDYEVAAEFARHLCHKGSMLFTLQKPSAKQERIFTANRAPAFEGLIVVLIDSRTTGPAEALAATLRANAGAMVVGSDTAGAAVEFETLPLGAGSSLQIAVSQVLLPGSEALFPRGVKPDIAIALPIDIQDRIFSESAEKGVSPFVFETERERLNEAALVANMNPELDAAGISRRDRSPAPRDVVLQRAVDLVTAIQFYSRKPGP